MAHTNEKENGSGSVKLYEGLFILLYVLAVVSITQLSLYIPC